MRRIVTIQTPNPAALPGIAVATLSASVTGSTTITLTATFADPTTFATFTFQTASSDSGPWTTLATQVSGTYPVTGLVASTKYYYRVNAQINDGRSGQWIVTNATTQSASSGTRWHPGWVLGSGVQTAYIGNQTQAIIDLKADLDFAFNRPSVGNITVWKFGVYASLFVTSQGNYDFSLVDTICAYASSTYGKRVAIGVPNSYYSGSSFRSQLSPAYLTSDIPTYGVGTDGVHSGYSQFGSGGVPGTGMCLAVWRTVVGTEFINWFSALAAHCNSISNVEYLVLPETSMSVSTSITGSADVTAAKLIAHHQALALAVRTAAPNVQVDSDLNYYYTLANMGPTVDFMKNNSIAFGCPDTIGQSQYPAQDQYYAGQAAYLGIGSGSTTDYRGLMACMPDCQGGLLNSNSGPGTPTTMSDLNARFITLNANFPTVRLANSPATNGDYVTQVLPYMQANPVSGARLTAPTNYSSVDTS